MYNAFKDILTSNHCDILEHTYIYGRCNRFEAFKDQIVYKLLKMNRNNVRISERENLSSVDSDSEIWSMTRS